MFEAKSNVALIGRLMCGTTQDLYACLASNIEHARLFPEPQLSPILLDYCIVAMLVPHHPSKPQYHMDPYLPR